LVQKSVARVAGEAVFDKWRVGRDFGRGCRGKTAWKACGNRVGTAPKARLNHTEARITLLNAFWWVLMGLASSRRWLVAAGSCGWSKVFGAHRPPTGRAAPLLY
jgi:hypothetical protein